MTSARYDGAALAPAMRLRGHGALRRALDRVVSTDRGSARGEHHEEDDDDNEDRPQTPHDAPFDLDRRRPLPLEDSRMQAISHHVAVTRLPVSMR